MNKFYIENKEDLRVLMVNTARKRNISEAVIEKDYWVTFILDYLFKKTNGGNILPLKEEHHFQNVLDSLKDFLKI